MFAKTVTTVIVFDHIEKTEVPKTWKRLKKGTIVSVGEQVDGRHYVKPISGHAKGFTGEVNSYWLAPLSALEILALEAE